MRRCSERVWRRRFRSAVLEWVPMAEKMRARHCSVPGFKRYMAGLALVRSQLFDGLHYETGNHTHTPRALRAASQPKGFCRLK
jgi:hypothetical protein